MATNFGASTSSGLQSSQAQQINTFLSFLNVLGDPNSKEDIKLSAAQELSENFELITHCAGYQSFLDHAMKIFMKILEEGEPQFLSESNVQQVRKLVLEMIHRLPTSESLRQYVKQILSLMLRLLQVDNEEIVLVCLRIIIELHKQFRPAFNQEIKQFLAFVKRIYSDLPKHLMKIFEPRQLICVKDLKDLDLKQLLSETYTITTINVTGGNVGNVVATYNVIPKGVLSLKVLQELPIIVVLMYQIYRQAVYQEVSDFVPLIVNTINLKPSPAHRNSPSFNKEVFVDFMGAQIKTLSFLAYIIKPFQEVIINLAPKMAEGMLSLLALCPKEVAHLRKELLVAGRHILATDMRNHFVQYMDRLFDEELLLGSGWTTHESLRPLAYSTLADLVHHVRQSLNINILCKAVHLFSKNVHDESLYTSIQTMSCKLLLNLVDCIRNMSDVDPNGRSYSDTARNLLITMLRVFTLKFYTIAKVQLPLIMQKWKQIKPDQPSTPTATTSQDPLTQTQTQPKTGIQSDANREQIGLEVTASEQISKLTSIGISPPNNLNVGEYRSLVKTLVCGVKTITWGCASFKSQMNEQNGQSQQARPFKPDEVLIFIDLVHWALEALDIYTINAPTSTTGNGAQGQKPGGQIPRSKEEKEVLEHFSGVFLMMNNQNFQEIFASTIDYMVERIYKNNALQVIANSFLANPSTSPLFATVLVEYLLDRMEEMGSNLERSNLYLRLFKLVFGSVSLFAAENEQMLRPHLHSIVNRSMELAMTAKEPYNYFLLLRALFRSIGGGSHDLLYQEFLPLLPNLLEGLNRLQSGFHKQHMKDLFVELCLTVPVRLSSLLPYLPMLMDPLVSALNGSHTLISQGLRTLELCVDNLQPDFLYDHIQPVRADLMQALWRTLRNQDSAALVAFRVLGKFGGGNRKMMIEPQRLDYNDRDTPSLAIIAHFQDHAKGIEFPIDKVIESAFNALKSSSTDPYYWHRSWEVIDGYLSASLSLDDDKHTLHKLFMHPSFVDGPISTMPCIQYRLPDSPVRQTHQTALTAVFVAAATKELRQFAVPRMVAVVRHYTMVAIAQQAGPFPYKHHSQSSNELDPMVLIDALATIMGHEEKELSKPGRLALGLILETATTIMGNKERACRLPIMQYLAEKMSGLCYERPWYAKVGGCIALRFLCQHMSLRWLYQHLFVFLKAFMFVIMDLAGEVSNGAIDKAKSYLDQMLTVCMTPPKENRSEELMAIQAKAMDEVNYELVRQVTSPNTLVREQAMASLRLTAELQNKTITEVMYPRKKVLEDVVPPPLKQALRQSQPVSAQIGLIDGFTFCTTLEPRLITIDLSNSDHSNFFKELLFICEAEDQSLVKYDCYKNVTNLIPLRKSALRAIAACHYLTDAEYRVKILKNLLKSLEKTNTELQQTAFECLQKFIQGNTLEREIIHEAIKPLLTTLGDYRTLTLNGTKRLSYLTQLFPTMFNEKLCEQLLPLVKKMLETSIQNNHNSNFLAVAKTGDLEQKITIILGIFHQIPAASSKFIESLCRLILQTEKTLLIEPSCPYRVPLVKFLIRYPNETLDYFLKDTNVKDPQFNRFLVYMLQHKNGNVFRQKIGIRSQRLIQLLMCNATDPGTILQPDNPLLLFAPEEKYQAQHQAVQIIHTLTEYDDLCLTQQADVVLALRTIWTNDLYKSCETNITTDLWHLVAKILLHYFSRNPNDIELLFLLLRALCLRFIPDFQFLRDFLQNTVAQSYTVDWKRKAFFDFVECFNDPNMSQNLKAKILTSILIPSFAVSFDKGEGNKLIGAAPAPYQEDENNVVSVFIRRVINNDKGIDDAVRIALLQFSCLLVERASPHIHVGDSNNKRQGNKLRQLMTFAWPCLLSKNCVDPAARYHGHLLLSHIISRLAISKKIVLQVFHSLLKGHAMEARSVVRQALELLTPAMPLRMEDGHAMLAHWTKKIIVDEGHSMQQLFHILQLVVRHFKVYYPVRHHLVQHMINSIQRLGFSGTTTLDYRKLAVELAEVIIKWEYQRIRDASDCAITFDDDELGNIISGVPVKRSATDDPNDFRKKMMAGDGSQVPVVPQAQTSAKLQEEASRPIDKIHCDTVLSLLFRLACQVNDATPTPGTISPGESLSRRCVSLIRLAMQKDVWNHPFDLKLGCLDKIFASVEGPQPNFGNICTALELLTFLLTVLKKEQILTVFKPLQRGISACVLCSNIKVIKLMHQFLSKLMAIFPTDSHHKQEELEPLYATVSKMISEGLSTFEKTPQANTSSLFSTLMILKAACMNNDSYIDRLISPFMRLLSRLTREHLTQVPTAQTPADGTNPAALPAELLTVSLDLVKNRVGILGVDMRKMYIGSILVSLIEKSSDVKVMKAIVKMIEDWMKVKQNSIAAQHGPTLREKSILLVKLMQYVEKRFPDDQELNGQFLELVHYIYSDDQLKQTELTTKLEAAFLAGLRCNQPRIRMKFFEIFDGSMRRRLHDRLLYIICSHAWDSIGPHYWIKQSIELIILTASKSTQIRSANSAHLLPAIANVINLADTEEKRDFIVMPRQNDPNDTFESVDEKEEAFDMDMNVDTSISRKEESERPVVNREQAIKRLIKRQSEFLEEKRKYNTEDLLIAAARLCHMDTQLAERIWLDMFPRLWSILDDLQQRSLTWEMVPFLASGAHVMQKDCHPSAINTFVEALAQCQPTVNLPPTLLTYLGKAHNLWHRMTLTLEDLALKFPTGQDNPQEYLDPDVREMLTNDNNELEPAAIFDPLAQMYSAMHEEDLWAGLWQKYSRYTETNNAIAYEQMGFFEEAQSAYDLAMTKFKQEMANGPAPVGMNSELQLWETHWIRCARELNQWDIILDYAQQQKDKKSFLIMECAWRVPDWNLMKQALAKVEQTCPKQEAYKVNLYRGFLAILNQEEKHLNNVERYVELASALCMREWRRLPSIVSHIHLPILQVAQQIMELQEACKIHQSTALHDMKATVKTWRNRLPVIADDLSHWSDIFTWRQHHYQIINAYLEKHPEPNPNQNSLGTHASAQAMIHFGRIARKQNLTSVCQDSLSRIYTIPEVPIVDCFQKIRQQVKCYLQMAGNGGSNSTELQQARELIEMTNLNYFNQELIAEFHALKGLLLTQMGDSDEANNAFSIACSVQDTLIKAWASWGDFLEQVFTNTNPRDISVGVNAITCFLHACRHQNESKSRKYLAKVLWLLSFDDEKYTLMEALDKYVVGVPQLHWLPWIPQLLCSLVQYDVNVIMNLLSQVGRMYPQAVYFPIRTLYLTLKIEQREKHKSAAIHQATLQSTTTTDQQTSVTSATATTPEGAGGQVGVAGTSGSAGSKPPTATAIRATKPMWRCSKIMHVQREIHSTILSSLEGIVDQMVWFRENWYEEVLRQLRQGLVKCYAIAFDNRNNVNEATITPHTLNFVKKLVSTFGTGIENLTSCATFSEPWVRRTAATVQDPVFHKLKIQFTSDFDFSQPGSTKLHNLIIKLRKWIKILECRTRQLPKSFLIEDKCRFLSNFSQKTAEVELPGELLLPRHSHYHIRIARFMPRVDIVQKHNTAARRLHIRGTNGKIYPYLVVNDSGLGDARREERVLQLLRMLNHYLAKQKETSRRFLHITVPRVVAVQPAMRLVEDNPASLSLLDIYKTTCNKLEREHDAPIKKYYDRLSEVQARGSQTSYMVLRDILKEVQQNLVSKKILKDWAVRNFRSATDYWQFRKMFTLQLSLAYLCEYALHLTRLNAEMMYVHQDSGLINVAYFKFDIDDTTGELLANRPVPFRLTPNIVEFLNSFGITGPLTASAVATARCFVQPNFKLPSILRAILRDEIIAVYKKRIKDEKPPVIEEATDTGELANAINMEEIIRMVNAAVNSIMQRLNSIAQFDNTESNKMTTLVQCAQNPDNLCRMDPAWHPWI